MGMSFILIMILNLTSPGKSLFAGDLQQIQVSGTITDDKGVPLPGVNVIVKGTTIGTITDVDGKYTLNIPDQNAVIAASFIGFVTSEVPVGSRSVINISLVSEALALQEVVVVGYGTQKKVNVIGSITTVSSEEITAAPTPNVSSALSGRLPGLFVTQ